MSERFDNMSNEEIVNENIRLQNQTGKLIRAICIVGILNIFAYIVLILLKLGVI